MHMERERDTMKYICIQTSNARCPSPPPQINKKCLAWPLGLVGCPATFPPSQPG